MYKDLCYINFIKQNLPYLYIIAKDYFMYKKQTIHGNNPIYTHDPTKLREKYQMYIQECWHIKSKLNLNSTDTLTLMSTLDKYFNNTNDSSSTSS